MPIELRFDLSRRKQVGQSKGYVAACKLPVNQLRCCAFSHIERASQAILTCIAA